MNKGLPSCLSSPPPALLPSPSNHAIDLHYNGQNKGNKWPNEGYSRSAELQGSFSSVLDSLREKRCIVVAQILFFIPPWKEKKSRAKHFQWLLHFFVENSLLQPFKFLHSNENRRILFSTTINFKLLCRFRHLIDK